MFFIRSIPYIVAVMAAIFASYVAYSPMVEYAEQVGETTTAPEVYLLLAHLYVTVAGLVAGCLVFWWFKRAPKELR